MSIRVEGNMRKNLMRPLLIYMAETWAMRRKRRGGKWSIRCEGATTQPKDAEDRDQWKGRTRMAGPAWRDLKCW
jgi:hypothetical protein